MKKLTREELEIVAAVSHLGVELTAKNCMFCNAGEQYISQSRGELKYLALDEKSNVTICTIEEFNQCVIELAEAKWLNNVNHDYDEYKRVYAECEPLEWKNGDECFVDGYAKPIYRFIGKDPENCDWCWIAIEAHGKNVLIEDLSKPESLEQKAARERAELICRWTDDVFHDLSLEQLAELLVDAGVKLPKQQ